LPTAHHYANHAESSACAAPALLRVIWADPSNMAEHLALDMSPAANQALADLATFLPCDA